MVQLLWVFLDLTGYTGLQILKIRLLLITFEPFDQFRWIKDQIHLKLNADHFLFYKVDRQVALSKICKKLRILKLFLKKSLIKMSHIGQGTPLKRLPRVRGNFWYQKGCWNAGATCTFFEKTENQEFEKFTSMKLLQSAN